MKWLCIVLCCLLFIAGIFVGKGIYSSSSKVKTESSVLLERFKEVFKLVFVEASFSELYNQKDYYWLDISPFRKSAIIRIQAKVTAGVNMDSSKISLDELNKTIRLQFDPQPVILYMEHSLDYYDLQQGTFNSFSSSELTDLEGRAKELIRVKAAQSDLLLRAASKRDEMIKILNQFVQSIGWKLVVIDSVKNVELQTLKQ